MPFTGTCTDSSAARSAPLRDRSGVFNRECRVFQSWISNASASIFAGSAIIRRLRLVRCAATRASPVRWRTFSSSTWLADGPTPPEQISVSDLQRGAQVLIETLADLATAAPLIDPLKP